MNPLPPDAPPLRLTTTRVAEFFRFGCERQLRYELVPAERRGGDVPRPNADPALGPVVGPRPGAGLLAGAGRAWERRKLRQLIRRLGEERVLIEGWTLGDNPRRLPYERVLSVLRAPGAVEVLVQPELRLPDPAAFARRHGLDPERVAIAPAVPDLIRVRRLRDGRTAFQVVDIKSSAEARIAHFAQVAFYTLVLEEICAAEGVEGGVPDVRWGRIWARDGRGPRRFALGAYRHHVRELLRGEVARVTELAPAACAWQVGTRCGGCVYLEHCRAEADARDDLARVVGVTPTAKRLLAERGIRTVRELASSFRKDTYQGCHALESQAERIRQRAQAVRYGKVFDVESRTHLMPAGEDVRVTLSAEGDPVSGLCFALGMRVDGDRPPVGRGGDRVWLAERDTPAAERRMLAGLLDAVDDLLRAIDGQNRAGRGGGGVSVHFYVYDRTEFDLLRQLLLRHLRDREARPAIARLLRFLSPRALSARPDVARSAPGTVVADVVAALFALPLPYAYDLAGVSERVRPAEGGSVFRPPAGYGWPFSSQIAFERIHNVWRGRPFGEGAGAAPPEAVRARIEGLVLEKLAAVDSVVRGLRERCRRRDRLQMRKEPFVLDAGEGPVADETLETLRVFAELESAAEAVALRALHVLPAEERARRFECLRGMHLVERQPDGRLVFEFDPACRDAKLRVGDFNLILTNDDDRSLLEVGRQPWKRRPLTMELVEFDLACDPPRVALAPTGELARAEAERWIDLDRVCVLDRASSDFNTGRLLATLRALDEGHGEAEAILRLLRGEPPRAWTPPFGGAGAVAAGVLGAAGAAYGRAVLNPDQLRAWRSAFRRPVSLVWGPPGTGKTYLLAWMLIGLAAAARREGKACRILVTAATHRAIANVLAKLGAESAASGVAVPLRAVKLRGSGSEADRELEAAGVEVVADARLPALLREAEGGDPLIVGSTVWSLWKRMRAASQGGDAEEGAGAPVQPWFDVVVVDEASQMKVAEALVALSSMRRGASVVLCGDDRQLAPVLRGRYGPELGSLYGSIFSHLAAHFPRLALRESRRMNQALVEYPRELFYPGLVSRTPRRSIRLAEPDGGDADDALLRELFLAPEDAVVLCTYRGVRATGRNLFEARLAARIARLARRLLLDPRTGEPFTTEAFVAEGLAVLAPHRAQNSAVLAELRHAGFAPEALPVVDTVERMQGNERDMILVSYGVADREYAEAEAEFLLNPNRFNVAITRARAKLVVLVSEEVLAATPADEEVLAGSMALKGYADHCRDAQRRLELPGPDGRPVSLHLRYRRLGDPAPERPAPPVEVVAR